jgi:hypothetical protein
MHQGESILLQDLGRTVMDKIYLCAELLGQDYRTAVKTIGRRIEHAELTPQNSKNASKNNTCVLSIPSGKLGLISNERNSI